MNSPRICRHIAKAPSANAKTKPLSKSLQSLPNEEFQNFSPMLKEKNKTHQHTGDTDSKENEVVI